MFLGLRFVLPCHLNDCQIEVWNRIKRIKLECLIEELSYSCGVFIEFGESASTPVTDEVRFEGTRVTGASDVV